MSISTRHLSRPKIIGHHEAIISNICLSLTQTWWVFLSLFIFFICVDVCMPIYTKTITLSLRPGIWMFVSLNYNTPITGIIYIDVRTCLCWYGLSPEHLYTGQRPDLTQWTEHWPPCKSTPQK